MLRWTNGTTNEQSLRTKIKETEDYNTNMDTKNNVFSEYKVIDECLNNNIMLDVVNNPIFSRYTLEETNKREKNFKKMNERELYVQKNTNPFLSNNNYVEDIDVSNKYLMFKNSSN